MPYEDPNLMRNVSNDMLSAGNIISEILNNTADSAIMGDYLDEYDVDTLMQAHDILIEVGTMLKDAPDDRLEVFDE